MPITHKQQPAAVRLSDGTNWVDPVGAAQIPALDVNGDLPVSDATNRATGTPHTYTESDIVSPWTVPVGERIISCQIIAAAGGGDAHFNSDSPSNLNEGEAFERTYPATGPAIRGPGTTVTFNNIDRLTIETWEPA